MKLGEIVVHIGHYNSPGQVSSNSDEKQKSFYYCPFFEFLIHLFVNSLIFTNSLLNDSALGEVAVQKGTATSPSFIKIG